MLLLQIALYCLLYFLLVKCAVQNSGRNCLYFYPKAYLDEAQNRGLADKAAVMKQGKHFMTCFCILIFCRSYPDSRPLEPRGGLQNRLFPGRPLSGGRKLVRRHRHRPPLGGP